MAILDDENGGFGLNNGQETPTGRPLSLSRVKAEVAYSAACCTYTSNRLQIGRVVSWGSGPMTGGPVRALVTQCISIGPTSGTETIPSSTGCETYYVRINIRRT